MTTPIRELFPQLAWAQAICRPSNGIPPSAVQISQPQRLDPSWLQSLAPQEKICLNLRLDQLKAIFEKTTNQLTEAQQSVVKELHALSEGISGEQLNGFRLLFPLLILQSHIVDYQHKFNTPKRAKSVKEYTEAVNTVIPTIFSTIEDTIKRKEAVSSKVFHGLLERLRLFFNQMPDEAIRDHILYTKQKNAFFLLERCLNDPETLFPLLLSPFDNLKARYYRHETLLLAVYFTESKRTNVLGTVHLLTLGLQNYSKKSEPLFCEIEKTLKCKSPQLSPQLKELQKGYIL